MSFDLETWLIETGDAVILAMENSSLSDIEQAIYDFWVIDYAIRNSGTLELIEDIHPAAVDELTELATQHHWHKTSELLTTAHSEDLFCEYYYLHFETCCEEIRQSYLKN